MVTAASVEAVLARVGALRAGGAGAEGVREELVKYLGNKSNVVVGKAAEAVGALGIAEGAGAMEKAFERLMAAGSDKGCVAKTAIAKALSNLEAQSEGVFLSGVRHVQMEPTWGGQQDVAGELRAVSGLALATMGCRGALVELADLLMDPDPQCRLAAARGIGVVGHESGELALRVKVLAGDERGDVVEECLASLLNVQPGEGSARFVGRVMGSAKDEEVRTAAAMALGASRRADALGVLTDRWETTINPEVRRPLVAAIALSRLPAAVEFLIGLVESAHRSTAIEAVTALAGYRHDTAVRGRVTRAVEGREEAVITEAFREAFQA